MRRTEWRSAFTGRGGANALSKALSTTFPALGQRRKTDFSPILGVSNVSKRPLLKRSLLLRGSQEMTRRASSIFFDQSQRKIILVAKMSSEKNTELIF